MKKKILSLVLACSMMLSIQAPIFAYDEIDVDSYVVVDQDGNSNIVVEGNIVLNENITDMEYTIISEKDDNDEQETLINDDQIEQVPEGYTGINEDNLYVGTYYVSSSTGNDSNTGTSPQTAWKTVDKVNSLEFGPGAEILFKAGDVWDAEVRPYDLALVTSMGLDIEALAEKAPAIGLTWPQIKNTVTGTVDPAATAFLSPKGNGDAENPITIGKYGTSSYDQRPVFNGLGKVNYTVHIQNMNYVIVEDIEVTNFDPTETTSSDSTKVLRGIYIENRGIETGTMMDITVQDCYIHSINARYARRFNNEGGIIIRSTVACTEDKIYNFDGVYIYNNTIKEVDYGGIFFRNENQNRGPQGDGLSAWVPDYNIHIKGNSIDTVGGDAIVVVGAQDHVVEYNLSKDAHTKCEDPSAGIWPINSTGNIYQYNEAYLTRQDSDGQGYDADGISYETIFQYNYSHDNEGGFILICDWGFATDVTVRYNISQNDRSKLVHHCGPADTKFYNNTFYIGPGNDVAISHSGGYGVAEYINNIFYNAGTGDLHVGATFSSFENNIFYGEAPSGVEANNIVNTDPMLLAPGTGGILFDSVVTEGEDRALTWNDLVNEQLAGYKLMEGSPAIDAGIPVEHHEGHGTPTTDFFGNPITGGTIDIGAHEFSKDTPETLVNIGDVFNFAEGYSDVSGLNHWHYLRYNTSSKTPLITTFDINDSQLEGKDRAWRANQWAVDSNWNGTFVGIKPTTAYILPGEMSMPTSEDIGMAFVAPVYGEYSVTGKASLKDTGDSDGVYVSLRLNGSDVLEATLVDSTTDVNTNVESVILNKGDILYFIANRNENNTDDTLLWNPSVTLVETEVEQTGVNKTQLAVIKADLESIDSTSLTLAEKIELSDMIALVEDLISRNTARQEEVDLAITQASKLIEELTGTAPNVFATISINSVDGASVSVKQGNINIVNGSEISKGSEITINVTNIGSAANVLGVLANKQVLVDEGNHTYTVTADEDLTISVITTQNETQADLSGLGTDKFTLSEYEHHPDNSNELRYHPKSVFDKLYSNTGFAPNGNDWNGGTANGNNSAWFTVELEQALDISKLGFYWDSWNSGSNSYRTFVSADGVNWTKVQEQLEAHTVFTQTHYFDTTLEAPAKYIKVEIDRPTSGTNCILFELEIFHKLSEEAYEGATTELQEYYDLWKEKVGNSANVMKAVQYAEIILNGGLTVIPTQTYQTAIALFEALTEDDAASGTGKITISNVDGVTIAVTRGENVAVSNGANIAEGTELTITLSEIEDGLKVRSVVVNDEILTATQENVYKFTVRGDSVITAIMDSAGGMVDLSGLPATSLIADPKLGTHSTLNNLAGVFDGIYTNETGVAPNGDVWQGGTNDHPNAIGHSTFFTVVFDSPVNISKMGFVWSTWNYGSDQYRVWASTTGTGDGSGSDAERYDWKTNGEWEVIVENNSQHSIFAPNANYFDVVDTYGSAMFEGATHIRVEIDEPGLSTDYSYVTDTAANCILTEIEVYETTPAYEGDGAELKALYEKYKDSVNESSDIMFAIQNAKSIIEALDAGTPVSEFDYKTTLALLQAIDDEMLENLGIYQSSPQIVEINRVENPITFKVDLDTTLLSEEIQNIKLASQTVYGDKAVENIKIVDGQIVFELAYDNMPQDEDEVLLEIYGDGTKNIEFEVQVSITSTASSTTTISDANIDVTGVEANYEQTGSAISPKPQVALKDGTNLTEGTDYRLVYLNNVKLGTSTLHVVGIKNYSGVITKTFEITQATKTDISTLVVTGLEASYSATGIEVTPNFAVKDGDKTLIEGTDYTVEYSNNISAGTATITITAKGDFYEGQKTAEFTILPVSISIADVTGVEAEYTATGLAIKPAVTVSLDGRVLVEGTDYEVTYGDNREVGEGSVEISGIGSYNGSKTITFTIIAGEVIVKDIENAIITGVEESYIYTGEAHTPEIAVELDGETLIHIQDYTVVYTNNTQVGTATITVSGKNTYGGTASKNFEIVAAPATDIATTIINGMHTEYQYTGEAIILQNIALTDSGKELIEGTDYTIAYENNVEIGTAKIIFSGINDYTGTKEVTFEIVEVAQEMIDLSGATVTGIQEEYTYTGAEITPVVTVELNDITLTLDTDYTVVYSNNKNIGTAKVTVVGAGRYEGVIEKTFEITRIPAIDISSATVMNLKAEYQYTGEAVEPTDITVMVGTAVLKEGVDYTVALANNTEIGEASITFTGINDYTGTKALTFKIVETPKEIIDMSGATVTGIQEEYTYTGQAIEPTVVVTLDTTVLELNKDYQVVYHNNTSAGTAIVAIVGEGDYKGTIIKNFNIVIDMSSAIVTGIQEEYTYTGQEIEPAVVVTLDGTTLAVNADYTVVYSNNKEVGTATVTITGTGDYTGEIIAEFEIVEDDSVVTKTDISNADITGVDAKYTYTGEEIKPTVTVTLDGTTLTATTDYTVAYSDNTQVGTAKIVVTGTGNYEGEVQTTFEIEAEITDDNDDDDDNTGGGNTGGSGNSGNNVGGSITPDTSTDTDTDADTDADVEVDTSNDGTYTNDDASTTVVETDLETGDTNRKTTYENGIEIDQVTTVAGQTTANVSGVTETSKVVIRLDETPSITQVAVIVYEDGTTEIIKDSISVDGGLQITIAEDAKIVVIDNSKSFSDSNANDWFNQAVDFVTSRELFNGTNANEFSPETTMTRAMIWTVLYRYDGEEVQSDNTEWYAQAQEWATINGISDGTNADGEMTREQLATLLYRFENANFEGTSQTSSFTDGADVSDWASDAMNWAISQGLISGNTDGTLNPTGNATRAEVATILMRYIVK